MTAKFNRLLALVKISVRGKFHKAQWSGSWVIVLTEKNNLATMLKTILSFLSRTVITGIADLSKVVCDVHCEAALRSTALSHARIRLCSIIINTHACKWTFLTHYYHALYGIAALTQHYKLVYSVYVRCNKRVSWMCKHNV